MSWFLSIENVLAIHDDQIDKFGGSPGIRDEGLLQSAIGQPEASFGGTLLHDTVFDLVKNHPFIDGNKRVGLACALIFLDLNDHRIAVKVKIDELYGLTIGVVAGNLNKKEIATRFETFELT